VIPLYGFLQGDVLGILLLADAQTTLGELAEQLQQAARLRVARRPNAVVKHRGRALDARLTVKQANLEALERIDVEFPA
jgi:Toluene-4-monooxygenase system protein B (TmoB)